MAKLWQKDYNLDELIERFTVGEDYILDRRLVPSDCLASMAHATMLASIGILEQKELTGLKKELAAIIAVWEKGDFLVGMSDEDCHTAIENRLSEKCGEAGKKIHTGRSRNDQVIAALRLYAREGLLVFRKACCELAGRLLECAEKHEFVPMPGRTHMQAAMPSSIGLWAGAYAEELVDDLNLLKGAYRLNDMCPLGSAASYGVPLPLDREMVSELLGFGKVQNNVLYVNNSRGKIESVILDAATQVMLTLSRLAQDLILFSLPEFGYFSLPDILCSGSSIMPQKKNPDGLELVRAKAKTLCSLAAQVKCVIAGLPSGYNRDFQETKGPLIRGLRESVLSTRIMSLTCETMTVNGDRLRAGFTPDIFATDAAMELVKKGLPFREAYRETAKNIKTLSSYDPDHIIRTRTYTGTTGKLCLEKAKADIGSIETRIRTDEETVEKKLAALAGRTVTLFGV
ncbi:MAG: argininosuccinate lyase [Spirochaetales bacterium]|nr:argininosuccinate lyase [Spirochaetales bacterium]